MSAVYSTCFLSEHGVDSGTVLEYDFPPGFVYVVREIACFVSNATGDASASAYDEHLTTFWQDQNTELSVGVFLLYQGRQVFDKPAGKLFLTFSGVSIGPTVADWRVSGYKLTLP